MNATRCPECAGPITGIYHQIEIIDPDESPARMLAERGQCADCGDIYLRNASADL